MADLIGEVEVTEERRLKAMVNRDTQVLSELLDDELIYVHSTGQCMTKGDYLAHVSDLTFAYLTIDATPDRFITSGDTVVLVERVSALMRIPSLPEPVRTCLVVLTVWRPSSEGWRLLSSIASPIKA